MQKQLHKIALFICMVLLISCSDDDANTNGNSEARLIKKITYNAYFGGEMPELSYENVYHYEDNVLKSIVMSAPNQPDLFRSEYIYFGNKITKVLYFERNQTQPYAQSKFTYEGNFLKTIENSQRHEKIEFLYQNGVISAKNVYMPEINGTVPEILSERYEYTFAGGNVISEKRQENMGGIFYQYEDRSVFDGKNNPMKNMNPYYRLTYNSDGFQALSQNNYLSTDNYHFFNLSAEYVFEIEYNSENYPVRISRFFKQTHGLVSQTDFEYL